MQCDFCNKFKDQVSRRQSEDNSFGIIGGHLDWLNIVPKVPEEFPYKNLCHECIDRMIFTDEKMLIDRSYYDSFDYSWVNKFGFKYITMKAMEKYRSFQESKIRKFDEANTRITSQDLTDYYSVRDYLELKNLD